MEDDCGDCGLRYCVRHAEMVVGEFRVLEKKLSSVVGLGCRDGVAMVSNESSRRRLEIHGIDWKCEISSSFVRILEGCIKYEQA